MRREGLRARKTAVRRRKAAWQKIAVYLAAAVLLLLAAGCGWQSGTSFLDEFDPQDTSPVAAVKKWFKSMEWREDEDGVRNPDNGRDFALFLQVVNPDTLLDSNGQFIGLEQLKSLEERWNSKDWEVEFKEVRLEEGSVSGDEAVVKIVGGGIRYIGKDMFGTVEYKMDSFGDKEGEVRLRWYEDPANDPLLHVEGFQDIAGKGRWVVLGGLDLSEKESWGVAP